VWRDAGDRDLVAAAQAGERDALEALLRRHHDRLHAICRRIVANDADALDATQEALIAIARNIGRFDGRAAFTTWSYRVAANAALDELRRRGRRRTVPLADDLGATTVTPTPAGGLDDPERAVERDEIDAALAALPDEFRVAVVLRDLCDLDYAEISAVLEIPPGTVRSRIARGRAALAAHLGNPSTPAERPTT
jgi:RNA polymerase sigma-70 factor (ECF subfamily)